MGVNMRFTCTRLFHPWHTVFIRILAAATFDFCLAGVWLLIEGGSYLRAAFINFGAISPTDIDTVDSFSGPIFKIYNQEISSGTKPRTFSATFLPRTNDRSWLAIVATLT